MEIPHKQVEELLCEAAEQKIIPLWQNLRQGDVALSTYVVHHLTQQEKELLFDQLVRRLLPGGCALFGDLGI